MDDTKNGENQDNLKCVNIYKPHTLKCERSPTLGQESPSTSGQSLSWFESVVHKEEESFDSVSFTEDILDSTDWEQEFDDSVSNDALHTLLKDLKSNQEISSRKNWEETGIKAETEEGYQCPHCPIRIRRKAALQTHISNHLEIRDCSECKYRAVNKVDLEAHFLDVHSDSKPRKPKYSKKIVYHAGFSKDKIFKCPKCPYRSNRKWNVNSHLKTHFKIKSSQKRKYERLNKIVNNFVSLKAPPHILEYDIVPETSRNFITKDCEVTSTENPCSTIASTTFDYVNLNANADNINSFSRRLSFPDKSAGEEMEFCSAGTSTQVSSTVDEMSASTSLSIAEKFIEEMESCSTSTSAQVSPRFADKDKNIVSSSFHLDSEEQDVKTSDSYTDLEKPVLLKCIECSFTTNKQFILKEHISNHPGMKLFNCARCDFSTDKMRHFNTHILSHSSLEVFKCKLCDYVTNRKYSLNAHALTHTSCKEYKCNDCSFETRNYRNLKNHLVIHSNETIYKCSECDYESNVEKYLKTHSLVHCPEEQQYKCPECDYMTPRKGQLRIHSLKHTDIKLYKCSICDFKTNRKCSLKVHSLSHSTEKLFKCTICNYDTNQKLLLRLHVLNHLNVKLYKCPNCDYSTNHSSHFKRHFQTHV